MLCWSEKAQLSGDRRKVLNDSTVMYVEVESSSFVVENFVKRDRRSVEFEVDFTNAASDIIVGYNKKKNEFMPFVFHA